MFNNRFRVVKGKVSNTWEILDKETSKNVPNLEFNVRTSADIMEREMNKKNKEGFTFPWE